MNSSLRNPHTSQQNHSLEMAIVFGKRKHQKQKIVEGDPT